MTWLTLGLLLVAGVQVELFRRQLSIMNTSLKDAESAALAAVKSAEAADASVVLSRETAKRQLRAYLSVSTSGVWPDDYGDTGRVFVTIRNTGHTPAFQLLTFPHKAFLEKEAIRSFAFPPAEQQERMATTIMLGPGCDFTVRQSFTKAELTAIRAGTHRLYIFGTLGYTDAFGDSHYTSYRYWWGNGRMDEQLRRADAGNDGD